ncbi:MAG: class I SAM-dependent methyltransferase [Oscillospiraceae bacterium]|nr:class I SAM-dependent methyltransferase [Oscillospiraceae bacterium]
MMENESYSVFSAADYEAGIRQTYPFFDEFHRQILETVRVHYTEPVSWLDLGSGTGTLAARAFRTLPVRCMYCCEPSAELLETARKRLNAEQTVFLNQDFAELQLSERFDIITAVQVFHFLKPEEKVRAIRRCRDMLTANGMFFTFENIAKNSQEGEAVSMQLWREYQKRMGKTDDMLARHLARYRSSCYPMTIQEHLTMLQRCGFEQPEVLWVSGQQAGFYGIRRGK